MSDSIDPIQQVNWGSDFYFSQTYDSYWQDAWSPSAAAAESAQASSVDRHFNLHPLLISVVGSLADTEYANNIGSRPVDGLNMSVRDAIDAGQFRTVASQYGNDPDFNLLVDTVLRGGTNV